MANFNKVILLGNMTRDPVLKYLPSGTAVVEFGLAVNRTWNDQASGQKREATTFVDCKSMGRPAETINQYMRKGKAILVEGHLDYRAWEAKDGSKRSKLEVFVEGFQFVGAPREGEGRRTDGGGESAPRRGAGPETAGRDQAEFGRGAPQRSGHAEAMAEEAPPFDDPGSGSGFAPGPASDGADDDVPF